MAAELILILFHGFAGMGGKKNGAPKIEWLEQFLQNLLNPTIKALPLGKNSPPPNSQCTNKTIFQSKGIA